jgi:predicted nucleic acid-binding Zn ribbon protein
MSREDRKQGPIRVDRILDGVLSEYGLDEGVANHGVLSVWSEIVGERVAAHVDAVDLRDGVLLLDTKHGAWRQEITLLLPHIRRECNRRFGDGTVTDIRWVRAWTRRPDIDNGI